MKYKLIVCDVDGTLLDSRFIFNQTDKDAIAKAIKQGVRFAICSGRAYKSLRDFAGELGLAQQGDYIVSFNGALIYDPFNRKVVMKKDLDKQLAIETIKLCKGLGRNIETILYTDGENCICEKDAVYFSQYQKASLVDWREADNIIAAAKETPSISKIVFIAKNDVLKTLEAQLQNSFGNSVGIVFSSHYLLEVIPKDCDKAGGLRWLCHQMRIDISQTIAIGDNHNDISMIKQAGLGVAVANAVQPAKDAADYVTINDCANGAVAEVINKYIL